MVVNAYKKNWTLVDTLSVAWCTKRVGAVTNQVTHWAHGGAAMGYLGEDSAAI